jgi:hypothetical protein
VELVPQAEFYTPVQILGLVGLIAVVISIGKGQYFKFAVEHI